MAEDDGLGDAGRCCDFLGGGAAESFAGEEIQRRFDELPAGRRRVEVRVSLTASIVSQYLLTVKG